jgi:hypothetical protein
VIRLTTGYDRCQIFVVSRINAVAILATTTGPHKRFAINQER